MNYFEEYLENYDLTNDRLSYKYHHSKRVMDNMEIIAKGINLSQKDIKLAKIIGLFHDIGRFEQYNKYKTFKDTVLDHGNYAKEILEENNILSRLGLTDEECQIVYKSIINHNKYEIETNLTERELLFSKMIRDADKLDILYALGNKNIKPIFYQDDSHISSTIKEAFFKEKPISLTLEETKNDRIVTLFAFAYDLNFDITREIVLKNKYYEKIYERLNNQEEYKPYLDYVNKYLKERNDKHVK